MKVREGSVSYHSFSTRHTHSCTHETTGAARTGANSNCKNGAIAAPRNEKRNEWALQQRLVLHIYASGTSSIQEVIVIGIEREVEFEMSNV